MSIQKIVGVLIMSATITGCYGFQGPERIMSSDSQPINLPLSNIDMFINDFVTAQSFRDSDPLADNPHVTPLLRSGFMYNYTFCESWFNQMVQNQRRSQIVRGVIPPITTLITGLIGLGDFSNNPGTKEDFVASLAIGSAATNAGLNIYDQHFLFGAENFGAVKALALRAQSTHADQVLRQTNVTFEDARQHLIDNQANCSPDMIMTLARDVMANAPLSARTQTSDGPAITGSAPSGQVTVGPKPAE